jgi:hypothetical protein
MLKMGHLGVGVGCSHLSCTMSKDEAFLLDLLRQEGNPEDGHHLMLCIGIDAMIMMQLHIESIFALVPHDLHALVCGAGKWDGINLLRGPDVVKI